MSSMKIELTDDQGNKLVLEGQDARNHVILNKTMERHCVPCEYCGDIILDSAIFIVNHSINCIRCANKRRALEIIKQMRMKCSEE